MEKAKHRNGEIVRAPALCKAGAFSLPNLWGGAQ